MSDGRTTKYTNILTNAITLYYPLGHRPGRIDDWAYCGPILPGRRQEMDTLRADLCSPTAHPSVTKTVVKSDCCEQNVNKHLLAESAAYFGLKMVINV